MIVLTRWKAAAKGEYLARDGQTHFVLIKDIGFGLHLLFKNYIFDPSI